MKILFVDDEPQILRGIERMLDSTDDAWDSEFVTSGTDALQRLDDSSFDVVVSDMQMPHMDGAQLLSRVSEQYPKTVRIVLSGQASRNAVLRAVQPMHQYLAKPCNANTLRTTVLRACQLRDLLHDEHLLQLIGSVQTLPSVPALYTEVMDEIESEDGTAAGVGEIVACDPGMTAKILQLTNSAAFGLGREISSPLQAASLLGMDVIKSLVLSLGVFRQFDESIAANFSIDSLFHHSTRVASLARRIALHQECRLEAVAEAFTAAMLHDIGKLVLATSLPEKWAEVQQLVKAERIPVCCAEQEVLGTDHAVVGSYLLSLWGLPQALVEAIAFHHRPNLNEEFEFSSLTAVSAANFLIHESEGVPDAELEEGVMAHLEQIGVESELRAWRGLMNAGSDD